MCCQKRICKLLDEEKVVRKRRDARRHHRLALCQVIQCVRRNNIVTTWWQRYCHQVLNPQSFMQCYKGPSSGFGIFLILKKIALTVTEVGRRANWKHQLTSFPGSWLLVGC